MQKNVNASAWYAGTAIVIITVLVGGWFGFSSGKMASAASIREEVEQAEHRNQILNTRIQALRADFEKLDEYKAEIAALEVGVPTTPEFSQFIQAAADLADDNNIVIANIQPVPALTIVPEAEPEETPEEAPADAEQEGEEEAPAPAPEEPEAEAIVEGFAGIPIMFTVAGETADVNAFLAEMQELDRLFLPTIIRQQRLDESPPAGGMPEIPEGWIEMDLTGYIYVFQHAFAEPVDSAIGEFPRGRDERNPFIPIEGREGSGIDSDRDTEDD